MRGLSDEGIRVRVAERLGGALRRLRHGSLASLPTPLYRSARWLALGALNIASGWRGRSVRVGGRFPLRVEWSRAGLDFETWEAGFTRAFGETLREEDIVFDVGASIGEWSALAASIVGPARVHVFEPDLPSWSRIERVFRLNRLSPPAGMFQGFVAARDEVSGVLWSSVVSRRWPNRVEGETAFRYLSRNDAGPRVTLDTYVRMTGVRPTVVKIDVEGAEGEVLRGAETTLRAGLRVFLSLHPWALPDYGDSKDGLIEWLQARNYCCSLLSVDHEEHWLCAQIS